jgi:hypothetical protein
LWGGGREEKAIPGRARNGGWGKEKKGSTVLRGGFKRGKEVE